MLSKQNIYLLKLMKILYREDGNWLNINHLAKKLDISSKTIKQYLKTLENQFSSHSEFSYYGLMVQVVFKPNFGLITIKKIFLSDLLIVKIIKECLFNSNIDKVTLATSLYSSESTIYNSIKNFNEKIKENYDIHLDYKNLKFIGNEETLRKFFVNFLLEVTPNPLDCPFEGILPGDVLSNFTKETLENFHIKIDFSRFRYIKIAYAVSFLRYKNKCYLEDMKDIEIIKSFTENIMKNRKAINLLQNIFPYPKDSLKEIVYQTIYYFSAKEFTYLASYESNNKEKLKQYLKEYKNHFEYFRNAFYKLKSKYNIGTQNLENLFLEFIFELNFEFNTISSYELFSTNSKSFINYVKNLNPEFHADLEILTKEFLNRFYPKYLNKLNTILQILYYISPNLIPSLIHCRKKFKTLIISQYDTKYANSLKSIVNHNFCNYLVADVYDEIELDQKNLIDSPYEIIITDFILPFELDNKLVISFEQLPRLNKSINILKTIIDFRNKGISSSFDFSEINNIKH